MKRVLGLLLVCVCLFGDGTMELLREFQAGISLVPASGIGRTPAQVREEGCGTPAELAFAFQQLLASQGREANLRAGWIALSQRQTEVLCPWGKQAFSAILNGGATDGLPALWVDTTACAGLDYGSRGNSLPVRVELFPALVVPPRLNELARPVIGDECLRLLQRVSWHDGQLTAFPCAAMDTWLATATRNYTSEDTPILSCGEVPGYGTPRWICPTPVAVLQRTELPAAEELFAKVQFRLLDGERECVSWQARQTEVCGKVLRLEWRQADGTKWEAGFPHAIHPVLQKGEQMVAEGGELSLGHPLQLVCARLVGGRTTDYWTLEVAVGTHLEIALSNGSSRFAEECLAGKLQRQLDVARSLVAGLTGAGMTGQLYACISGLRPVFREWNGMPLELEEFETRYVVLHSRNRPLELPDAKAGVTGLLQLLAQESLAECFLGHEGCVLRLCDAMAEKTLRFGEPPAEVWNALGGGTYRAWFTDGVCLAQEKTTQEWHLLEQTEDGWGIPQLPLVEESIVDWEWAVLPAWEAARQMASQGTAEGVAGAIYAFGTAMDRMAESPVVSSFVVNPKTCGSQNAEVALRWEAECTSWELRVLNEANQLVRVLTGEGMAKLPLNRQNAPGEGEEVTTPSLNDEVRPPHREGGGDESFAIPSGDSVVTEAVWDFCDEQGRDVGEGVFSLEMQWSRGAVVCRRKELVLRDLTPPMVSFDVQEAGLSSGEGAQISWSVEGEAENVSLQLLRDGTEEIILTNLGCSGEEVLPLASGEWRVELVAQDACGNEAVARASLVLKARKPQNPMVTLELIGLDKERRVVAEHIEAVAHVSGFLPKHLELYLDGEQVASVEEYPILSMEVIAKLPPKRQNAAPSMGDVTEGRREGRYSLQAVAEDAAGEVLVSEIVTFYYSGVARDYVAPSLEVAFETWLPGRNCIVTGMDNGGLERISVECQGETLAAASGRGGESSLELYTEIGAGELSSGVRVIAVDKSGNRGERLLRYPVAGEGIGSVKLLSEAFGTVPLGDVEVFVVCEGRPACVELAWNEQPSHFDFFPESNVVCFSIAAEELADGWNTVSARAWGMDGSASEWESVRFRTEVFLEPQAHPLLVRPWAGTPSDIVATAALRHAHDWTARLQGMGKSILLSGTGEHLEARFPTEGLPDGDYTLILAVPDCGETCTFAVEVDAEVGAPVAEITYPSDGAVVEDGVLRVLGSAGTTALDEGALYSLVLRDESGRQLSCMQEIVGSEWRITAHPSNASTAA
ncbi:MAG: hypothetical protein IJJ26_01550, partial [Victivallales bacterium]|nr:hypothetical protein [Victivallales bacterium]